MARLELPVRAFLEDRCKSAFPDHNWNRGTAISDLVIKAMAVLFQPLRSEIDILKVNQSVSNFQFMRRTDLDALAANFGKFRQTGSRSTGNVRLYFDTATNYVFNYLQFTAVDGTSFTLVAPVSISAQQLLSNRLQDGSYYFDVAVQSTGIGNRYALPAGSIVSVLNAPAGIIRVENIEDFQVTAPDEQNYDVVNSMFKNLGMRNLVSPASIRAPLLDQFAGIVDIFIAGADHAKMVRDLVTVDIDGLSTAIHVGGMTDIWVNTSSVVQKQLTLSYLPTSGRARIVSALQAAQNEVLYTFGRSFIDIDGLYSSPDHPTTILDESTGVLLNVAGLLQDTRVLGLSERSRYQLSSKEILSGTDMIVVPTKNNDLLSSPLLTDISGFDFTETTLSLGDLLLYNNKIQKVTRKSGRILEVGPSVNDNGFIVWNNLNDTLVVNKGDRFIPYQNDGSVCNINDRVTIPTGSAAGQYRVLKVNTTGFWVGNVVASGSVTFGSHDSGTDQYTYSYAGNLPPDVNNTCWVYMGSGEAFDQASNWFKIVSITRNEVGVTVITQGGTSTPPGSVLIVQGLRDSLVNQTQIWFENASAAMFARSTRQLFGDENPTSVANIGHTLYVNDTETQIEIAVTALSALGLGRAATVGNLILFDGTATITADERHTVQSDGSKFSVVVDTIVDDDTITFRPALPFAIPPGTRYALMRNHIPLETITIDSASIPERTVTLTSWPLGLGDGVGYILKHTSGRYAVMYSTAGALRTLYFKPPQQAIDITFGASGYITANPSDIGSTIVQTMSNGNTAVGVLTAYNNSTRIWSVVPNDISDDVFYISGTNPVSIRNSLAIGFASALSSPYATGYFDPSDGDVGSIVRQGTYSGILQSIDHTHYTWTIKPLSEYDLFDNTDTNVITFVDYGTGRPTASQGQGIVYQPASAPQLNTGPVTLTLDRAPDGSIGHGSTMTVYPRFPISGMLLSGLTFKTLPDTDIQFNPFVSTIAKDNILVMLGSNADTYVAKTKTKFNLVTSSALIPDIVRIHNALPVQPLPFSGVITAGTTVISLTGSGLGFWAQHGRVFVLTTGANTYYLAIGGPSGQDGLTLLDPVPVSLFSDQSVTYEIVEGFHTPFWTVPPSEMKKYRLFRQPALGDMLFVGATGIQDIGSPNAFTDMNATFTSILAAYDLAPEDLLLYIDDGPDASTTPFIITAVGTNALTLKTPISSTVAPLAYHIVHRNNATNREFWVNGVIQSGRKTIVLSVPNGWDVIRNGTYDEFVWVISSHPSGDKTLGDWIINGVTGSYDPGSKLLTLNLGTGQFTPFTSIPDTNGFLSTLVGQPCRVMPRLVDRAAAHNLGGSVIETFNYYLRDFFSLPIIRVQDVQLLDSQTLQSIRSIGYKLVVNDVGLRYSDVENNILQILDTDLPDAAGQPIRISYMADLSIAQVNSYLQEADTRIVNGNQLAKRMETISVDISVQVRSQLTETELAQQIATFINTAPSTVPLSKDQLIQYLYKNSLINYIDVGSLVLAADYYQADGTIVQFANTNGVTINQVFGSETACYLARNILVTQLAVQV